MFKLRMVTMWAVIMILAVPLVGLSQGYVQPVGATGNVNWTQQVVRCTGIGAPNPDMPMAAQRAAALRAARSDALRNLLETIKGIYLTSETTVENAMVVSDIIRTRVEGAMRDFNVVDTRYMSTGDVEVDVEIPLTGVILNEMLPSADQFGGGMLMTGGLLLCPVCGQPWPAGQPVPEGITLIQAGEGAGIQSSSTLYTGLVIDGRGLGVRPAMAPKVLDSNGEEIYGSRFVSREYAVDIGMVGYEKDINRARLNERVADNPLIIKGVEAAGANMTDIIISNTDAMQIHNAAANMNFLQHCKVMFILD